MPMVTDILLMLFSGGCLLAGLLGCVLPALPGPPIAYAALLLLHFTDKVQFTSFQLWSWLGLVVAVQVLDYFIPMLGTKYCQGSRSGVWGAFAGSLIGLFFLPWGLILGPFFGAVAGELLADRSLHQALKSGAGSIIGFIFGTVIKLSLCTYFIIQFFKGLWG